MVVRGAEAQSGTSFMIEPLLIVGIAIAATAWYVQHKWRRRARRMAMKRNRMSLDLLDRRYANGEIDRGEYLQKKDDILGYPGISTGRP